MDILLTLTRPGINLTGYYGILAPNHRWRGMITPAKRGKGAKCKSAADQKPPVECHIAMTWAQRLKRVFNIDIDACPHCGGPVKVIACIEEQEVIDRILSHLREKELRAPAPPLLVPPPSAADGDRHRDTTRTQGSDR